MSQKENYYQNIVFTIEDDRVDRYSIEEYLNEFWRNTVADYTVLEVHGWEVDGQYYEDQDELDAEIAYDAWEEVGTVDLNDCKKTIFRILKKRAWGFETVQDFETEREAEIWLLDLMDENRVASPGDNTPPVYDTEQEATETLIVRLSERGDEENLVKAYDLIFGTPEIADEMTSADLTGGEMLERIGKRV